MHNENMRAAFTYFLLFTAAAMPASALPISFSFGGLVEPQNGELAFIGGANFSLTYWFDPDSYDANSGDANSGFYPGAVRGGIFEVVSGSHTYSWSLDAAGANNNIQITRTADGHSYFLGADLVGPSVGGMQPDYLLLQLTDRDLAAFTSDGIPTSLVLSDFEWSRNLQVTMRNGACCSTFGTVTHASAPVSVPEPTRLSLLSLAMVAMIVKNRKRLLRVQSV